MLTHKLNERDECHAIILALVNAEVDATLKNNVRGKHLIQLSEIEISNVGPNTKKCIDTWETLFLTGPAICTMKVRTYKDKINTLPSS